MVLHFVNGSLRRLDCVMTVSISGSQYGTAQSTRSVDRRKCPTNRFDRITRCCDRFASDELIVFEALVSDVEETTDNLFVTVTSSVDTSLIMEATQSHLVDLRARC